MGDSQKGKPRDPSHLQCLQLFCVGGGGLVGGGGGGGGRGWWGGAGGGVGVLIGE